MDSFTPDINSIVYGYKPFLPIIHIWIFSIPDAIQIYLVCLLVQALSQYTFDSDLITFPFCNAINIDNGL